VIPLIVFYIHIVALRVCIHAAVAGGGPGGGIPGRVLHGPDLLRRWSMASFVMKLFMTAAARGRP